ncbi:CIC11C00000003127 [Sungouiella intermedia]|uniref:CIC11C00000003127 n=1 Tax=Sungouiella intermedia TaxID=45354 RepID=A0A1L0B9J7_9ASCO|nr:CIC11C00000003127 [[Candida] intermedia]
MLRLPVSSVMARSIRVLPARLMLFRQTFTVGSRYYLKTPFPIDYKKAQHKRDLEKLPKYKQWAAYVQTLEFKKRMTKYYVGMFAVMLVAFYYYMRDRYYEDKQMKVINAKYKADPASLSEYEYLKFKAFSGDKLKPREEKKFRLYQMMRKEFRRKNIFEYDLLFEPTPQDLEEWYNRQARRPVKVAAADDDAVPAKPGVNSEAKDIAVTNSTNPNIMPAQDTTQFYDEKAAEYDSAVNWEERGVFMGIRRGWLMEQAEGDVLEVACGTGRNIPYLNLDQVESVTFMDSSEKMVEETQKKFRAKYPKFKNVAYAVGKAENLVDLASESFKYDTIIEAFGLCAHEDPVAALKNMQKLLRPGGRIVLLEHGRSTWDFVNNHLDFRAEKRMKKWACRWNLDIGELVDEAGLDITFEKRVHLGSTWMLVCKRPEDPIRMDEKPFLKKLFGTEATTVKKE